jgi:outer membrane receptor for ferrienterochelin and colicin
LPVRSRKFLDLGVLVAGATEFGERDSSATADFAGVNHFYSGGLVDGTDAWQAWTNSPKAKQLVPFEFSYSAIGEFQVLTGSFNAEFGRSAGGLVNAVTRSGTNNWHGEGSYFLSDSRWNAKPRFAATKPETRDHLFSTSIGGPLAKDRLFMFADFSAQIRNEPLVVTSGTVVDGFDATLASITNTDERRGFCSRAISCVH